jgi:hypothetical protein
MINSELITYLLNNNGKPVDETWLSLAKKFEIGEGLNDTQRAKKCNDLWRAHNKTNDRQLSDFERTSKIKRVSKWQAQDGKWLQSIAYESNSSTNEVAEVKKAIIKTINEYEIPKFEPKYGSFNNTCAVINLYDAHLSKYSHTNDTGEDSNTDEAIDKFRKAFDELLTTASAFKPELIVIPFGNDYLHENSANNTTKKGTPLDVSGNHYENFHKGLMLIRECVDKASQVAKVFVPTVIGNHDTCPTIYMSTALTEIYKDNNNITIDNRRVSRKYLRFGKSFLGFTHGDNIKMEQLPLLMAIEGGVDFAETNERLILTGHIHHLVTKEFPGVTVRSLRSAGGVDTWHHQNGFIGTKRSANVMIFEGEEGLKAEFSVNIK